MLLLQLFTYYYYSHATTCVLFVAFALVCRVQYLSKSCQLQVQILQVALLQIFHLYFPWAEPREPEHKQMNLELLIPFAVAQLVFYTSLPSGRLEHCLPLRRVTLHIMVKQTPSLSNSNHLNGCQKSE